MPWEVRWFDNNIPKYNFALRWFSNIDDKFVKEKIREDIYLCVHNYENIGIKLRPSNYQSEHKSLYSLEMKLRKNIKPDFAISEKCIYGTLEEWIKYAWLLNDDKVFIDNDVIDFSSLSSNIVLNVKKLRYLRKYIIKDGIYKSEHSDRTIDEGLQWEITKIINNKSTWWSMGFEGIGNKTKEMSFRKTVQNILKECRFNLDRDNSFGYPSWINKAAKFLTK